MKERASAKQIDRKFESPTQQTITPPQKDRNIPTQQILHKQATTIHFPKQYEKVPIIKCQLRGNSNQSIPSNNVGQITLSYDDIRPQPKENSVIDKLTKFFTTTNDICKCPTSNIPNTCASAKYWLGESDLERIKNKFYTLLTKQIDNKLLKQINMDVERTHPLKEYPKKMQSLKSVLKAYAIYEPKLGYMQGMNFVAAALLYHCEDYIAFELFQRIMDKLPLKDLYLPMSPGLSKHIQLIDYLILTKLPDLYQHFCTNSIKVDMFSASWLFSLFGMMIPINKMLILLNKIFKEGWTYIYKLIITFLLYNQELLLSEDMTGIISILSQQNYRIDNNLEIDWEELLLAADNVQISKTFIQSMHLKYDTKGQVFKI